MGKKAIDLGLGEYFLQGSKLGVPGTSKTDLALDKLGNAINNGLKKPATKIAVLSTLGIASTVTTMRCISKGDKSQTISVDTNPEQAKTKTYSLDEILQKPGCEVYHSPNFDKGRDNAAIDTIVLHTTEGSGEGARNWLTNPQSKVSAHYVVMEDGSLSQLVDDGNAAWHCRGYNKRAIGIEIAGHADKQINDAQKETIVKLISYLIGKHSLSINAIKPHSELDPKRRVDPGEQNMLAILSSLQSYVNRLPIASADRSRLLGLPLENVVASAHQANPLADRELKQDVVHEARAHEFKNEDRNAWSVSRRYGINWDDFVAANPIPAKTKFIKLHEGDKLNIPSFKLYAGELDIRYIPTKLEASITIEEIKRQMNTFKSKMNAQRLYDIAIKHSIDPRFVVAVCRHESAFATKGEGLKNNNPGNLKISDKEFARYATLEQGVEALCEKLSESYILKGRHTAESIIPIYAPASDNNDTFAYIESIREQYRKASSSMLLASAR